MPELIIKWDKDGDGSVMGGGLYLANLYSATKRYSLVGEASCEGCDYWCTKAGHSRGEVMDFITRSLGPDWIGGDAIIAARAAEAADYYEHITSLR